MTHRNVVTYSDDIKALETVRFSDIRSILFGLRNPSWGDTDKAVIMLRDREIMVSATSAVDIMQSMDRCRGCADVVLDTLTKRWTGVDDE